MTDPLPEKKSRGCFFYGCLTLVVLLIVGAVATYFTGRYFIRKTLNTYTDTQTMALPKSELPQSAVDAIKKRVDEFKASLDAGKEASVLVLDSTDLNALITSDPDFAKLNGKIYVAVEGDQVKGQISLPLDDIGFSPLKGRYLNGAAAFKVSLENGVLVVTLASAEVKGTPLPANFLAPLQRDNLAKDFYRDPKNADKKKKFESIEIKDGKITVKSRPKEAPKNDPK